MAIPIQAQPRYGGRDFDNPLPSISTRDEGFGKPFGARGNPFNNDSFSPATTSKAMDIRGADDGYGPPPPLPPPPFVPINDPIDHNLHRQFKETRRRGDHGSPLSDSFGLSFERRDMSFKRDFPDEGYQSVDSLRPSEFSSTPFGMRSMGQFRHNDNGIDSSMLNKLNRPRPSNFSASLSALPAPRSHHTHLPTISLPHRTKGHQPYLDTTLTRSPAPMSARSPFSQSGSTSDFRSPIGEHSDFERSLASRNRRTGSGSVPDDATVSSYENREEDDHFPMETSRMRTLNIEDQWRERDRGGDRESDYCQVGQKRRASSPPSDDAPLPSDGVRRREAGALSRGSPTPRLTVIPHGSISSISSVSRGGSYTSNLTASSITSMGSFGRRSPNGLSPGGLSPTDPNCGSPFATPISVTTSPQSALSRSFALQSPHGRTLSEQQMAGQSRSLASPRKLAEIPKNPSSLVAAKMKGPYMCECCPKKPKKFETEEELKIHEAEKQYECSFCGNRFKNKNEAERHQNSLHVRRHSWSCSALTGYERAFHDSTTKPSEADTCGYCGDEFPRSGRNHAGAFINDQDWEDRIRHLQDVHKFRECNSSKKFYRADHFRQHLKHSHAGTSGKWTNMLENACMMEEDPPIPTR